jgi:hypothetical protein
MKTFGLIRQTLVEQIRKILITLIKLPMCDYKEVEK